MLGIFIIITAFSGCKTGKAPRFKRYVMEEKFVNIKGINVPELTPDRTVFNPSKDLIKDMKNSLAMNRIKEVYGSHDNAYREAIKHHMIKTSYVNLKSYMYEYVKYDDTYDKPDSKYETTSYNYTENDILDYIGEKKMQVIPLKEEIFTGDLTYSEYTSEVLMEYNCAFRYYPNGQLHHYSCGVRNAKAGSRSIDFYSIDIGTECDFDESGNLLLSMNHEEGFKMDFSTLLTVVLKGRNELIEKYKINGYAVGILYIKRNKNEFGSFWIVPYKLGEKRLLYRIIDDETGRVMEEFENDELTLKKYTEKPEEYIKRIKELRKSF